MDAELRAPAGHTPILLYREEEQLPALSSHHVRSPSDQEPRLARNRRVPGPAVLRACGTYMTRMGGNGQSSPSQPVPGRGGREAVRGFPDAVSILPTQPFPLSTSGSHSPVSGRAPRDQAHSTLSPTPPYCPQMAIQKGKDERESESGRGRERERETGRGRPGLPPCPPCHPSPVIRLQSEISREKKEWARIAGPAPTTRRAGIGMDTHGDGYWTRSQSDPDSVYKTDLSRPSIPSLLFLLTHTLSSNLQP